MTQRAAGANFSVDVALGVAVVTGDDQANQGKYLLVSTATENVVVTAAPGSNSRYDIVILDVNDPTAGGGAGDDFTVRVVAGSAAATPAVPATPDSALLLATIGPIATATASITTSLIADSRAVAKLAHENVIPDSAVGTSELAASSVTTAKIADANVTAAKIVDANVTAAKLATDSVTTAKIVAANVTTAKIADLNVTEAKLATAVLSSAWTALTVSSAGFSGFSGFQAPFFHKIGNTVTFTGTLLYTDQGAPKLDVVVGTIPVGYRPAEAIAVPTGGAVPTVMNIGSNGAVSFSAVDNTTGLSWSVTYPVP